MILCDVYYDILRKLWKILLIDLKRSFPMQRINLSNSAKRQIYAQLHMILSRDNIRVPKQR